MCSRKNENYITAQQYPQNYKKSIVHVGKVMETLSSIKPRVRFNETELLQRLFYQSVCFMCLFFFIWFSLTQKGKKRLLSEIQTV